MVDCPSHRNPYDDLGDPFTLTIEGIQYVWDEDDVVWRGGPPEGDHDDGFRKIGTLTYNDEDEEAMKQKLTTFVTLYHTIRRLFQ
jgi:hypothetical protein